MRFPPFQDPSRFPPWLRVGEYTYAGPGLQLLHPVPGSALTIGRFVCIGHEVSILLGGEHRPDRVAMFHFPAYLCGHGWEGDRIAGAADYPMTKGPITIGNDVWVGHRATILSGVTVADGAVVAAGSVVTADVEPYWIVGGVPARPLRRRFADSACDALLRIRWWDWDDAALKARHVDLMTRAAGDFVRAWDPHNAL